MTDYDTFIRELERELGIFLSKEYTFTFTENTRLNGVRVHTVNIRKNNSNISPCVHLDYFYEQYGCGRDITDIAKSITEIINMQPSFSKTVPDISWERVQDYIIFSLINYDANPEMISRLPHIRLFDLALIFRIDAAFMDFEGFINVNHALLKVLGKDINELLTQSRKNMNRLMPVRIIKMSEMLGYDDDMFDSDMLICTNSEKSYGAAGILYDELPGHLEYSKEHDYFVIPSSIHEVLLLKCEDYKAENGELEEIVRAVNQSEAVSASDYLSDSVYRLSEFREEFESLLPVK